MLIFLEPIRFTPRWNFKKKLENLKSHKQIDWFVSFHLVSYYNAKGKVIFMYSRLYNKRTVHLSYFFKNSVPFLCTKFFQKRGNYSREDIIQMKYIMKTQK